MDRRDRRIRRLAVALVALLVLASGVAVAVTSGRLPVDIAAFGNDPDPVAARAAPLEDSVDGDVATGAEQDRQAALVEAEDNRLLEIVSNVPFSAGPYEMATAAALPTVVLTARSRPYSLDSLTDLGAVENLPDGSWLLRRSVVVGRGAELRIDTPGTLRMTSGRSGFTSLVAFKGAMLLAGKPGNPLRLTSWDPATQAPDTDPTDGRAYVRSVGARMDLTRVDLTDLGFWSGRSGGLAWTGSAGGRATGSATQVSVKRSHYGLFTSRTDGLAVTESTFRDNELDGVLLHRDTTGLVARSVISTGNGRDGIVAARGADGIVLTGVDASANAGDGIRIDGSALAEAANAGGVSTSRGTNYTVEKSTARANGGAGVVVTGADGVRLTGNIVSGSREGIVLQGSTLEPEVVDNTVDAAYFGIAVRGGTSAAQVTGNRVGPAVIGVQVADATAAVTDNTVGGGSRYAVSLVGEVTGSTVTGNVLSGRGLRALDIDRAAPTATFSILGNNDRGWVTDRDNTQYWRDYLADHPLLLLWLLILLVPVVGRLRARRRRTALALHPYRNVAPGPGWSAQRPGPDPGPTENVDPPPLAARPTATRVSVVSGTGARQ